MSKKGDCGEEEDGAGEHGRPSDRLAQFCGVDGDRDEDRAANIDEPSRRSRSDAELAQRTEARDGLHAPRAGKESGWLRSFLWLLRAARMS